ncbi:MAG: sugar transferase, partial [Gemmatimonadales bacterium]
MPGIRSSNPSIPAVTGLESPLPRPQYRDWSRGEAAESSGPEWLRRSVNLILALIALIVLLPVMLLIALLVRLTSRGPVLYTQVRVGLDRRTNPRSSQNHRRERNQGGPPFTIYNFRTMRVDAEP